MKKYRFNFLAFCLLGLSGLVSCGGDDESDASANIVGTWQAQSGAFTVDGVDFVDYIKNLAAQSGTPITDADVAELEDEFTFDADDLASVWEFQADGTLIITDTDDNTTETGTWSVAGNTLTIDDGDEAETATIALLTGSELQLLLQFDEDDLDLEDAEAANLQFLVTFTR